MSLRSKRFSEIEAFWFRMPQATPEEVSAFTGELLDQHCDCGNQMRRFEKWNGICEPCRIDSLGAGRMHCGCKHASGHAWMAVGGWHMHGRNAYELCPKFWSRKEVEIEITRKVEGRPVKKKALVKFYVNSENPQKLEREFYVDGKKIDIKGKRGTFEDYG